MISSVIWTKIPRVPAMFQSVSTPVSILPIAATETLMSLRDEVRERGLGPDGGLFIRFLSIDRRGDEVRFETGVPTTKPWTKLEPLKYQSGDMPGGFAATTRPPLRHLRLDPGRPRGFARTDPCAGLHSH